MEIHGQKINFHSNTSGARYFLKEHLSRKGLQKFLDNAKDIGEYSFKDTRDNKYVLEYDGEDNSYHVRRKHS